MRTSVLFFGLACLLAACQSPGTKTAKEKQDAAPPPTLEPFADSLVRLNKYAPSGIETAAGYFRSLVPPNSTLADSAAVLLLKHAWTVLDTVNQKLYADTSDYFELVYNGGTKAPEAQKRFQQALAAQHIRLQGDGEGGVYAALDYSWLVPQLQRKTSAAADGYLTLLAKDEASPALLDAGLAIEVNELVDRLVVTESLLRQKLPAGFAEDLERKNKLYTSILLLGSDNSPALEYEKISLTEEFRKGYAYLLERYPGSKAAQVVREWQAVVAAKDRRKVEEWRTRYSLY